MLISELVVLLTDEIIGSGIPLSAGQRRLVDAIRDLPTYIERERFLPDWHLDVRAEYDSIREDPRSAVLLERLYEFATCNLYVDFDDAEADNAYQSLAQAFSAAGLTAPAVDVIDGW